MKFHEFLTGLRTNKNVVSVKDQFDLLGGEKKLKVSLRHFQGVAAGERMPSEEILLAVFGIISGSEQKACITAYFESVLEKQKTNRELFLEYLDQHLSPGVESETKSIWETGPTHMIYSDEQLDFLTKNPDALRLHRKALLFDKVPLTEVRLPKAKLDQLIELGLTQIENNFVLPSRQTYRLPNYDNSSPRSVAHATDYILAHLHNFISREGSPKQTLGYAMQNVKKKTAVAIVKQMESFKKWVQSQATKEEGPDIVPLIFVGLAKELEKKEI